MESQTPILEFPDNYDQVQFSVEVKNVFTKTVGGVDDVIYKVDYVLQAVFNDSSTFYKNTISFPDDQLEGANFAPYQSLTKDQIVGWVNAKSPMTHLKASLARRFVVETTKESPTPLPWSN
jgi:hypothetical protein